MEKVLILILSASDTHGKLGRAVNALKITKELKEAGDDVKIIFDGAGTEWIGKLAPSNHRASPLYEAVEDKIVGACGFCSKAFGVKEEVEEAGVPFLDAYDQHPSIRKYIADGYQVITF